MKLYLLGGNIFQKGKITSKNLFILSIGVFLGFNLAKVHQWLSQRLSGSRQKSTSFLALSSTLSTLSKRFSFVASWTHLQLLRCMSWFCYSFRGFFFLLIFYLYIFIDDFLFKYLCRRWIRLGLRVWQIRVSLMRSQSCSLGLFQSKLTRPSQLLTTVLVGLNQVMYLIFIYVWSIYLPILVLHVTYHVWLMFFSEISFDLYYD